MSDNGGPTNGNEGTSSNNFPMRGGKNTLWEVRRPRMRTTTPARILPPPLPLLVRGPCYS